MLFRIIFWNFFNFKLSSSDFTTTRSLEKKACTFHNCNQVHSVIVTLLLLTCGVWSSMLVQFSAAKRKHAESIKLHRIHYTINLKSVTINFCYHTQHSHATVLKVTSHFYRARQIWSSVTLYFSPPWCDWLCRRPLLKSPISVEFVWVGNSRQVGEIYPLRLLVVSPFSSDLSSHGTQKANIKKREKVVWRLL